MKTILYLHGFFSSGSCEVANALKGALADKVRVLTPDLPIRPKEALTSIIDLFKDDRVPPIAYWKPSI